MLELIYVIYKDYYNFDRKYSAINLLYCEYLCWRKYALFT